MVSRAYWEQSPQSQPAQGPNEAGAGNLRSRRLALRASQPAPRAQLSCKKTCATLGKSILSSRMASFFLICRKMPIRKQNDPKDSSFTGREELLSVRNAHFPSIPHKLSPESSVGGTGERWSALWVCAHLYAKVWTHTHKQYTNEPSIYHSASDFFYT